MKKKMKKAVVLLLTLAIVATCFVMSVSAYSGTMVYLTQEMQIVDSFNGVPTYYHPGPLDYSSNVYSCAAYPARYYSMVYGVSIYNLTPGRTPQVYGGYDYFVSVSNPRPGDIYGTSGHWAIVKAVNGSSITLIEQNFKWSNTSTLKDRVVSISSGWYFRLNSQNNGSGTVVTTQDSTAQSDSVDTTVAATAENYDTTTNQTTSTDATEAETEAETEIDSDIANGVDVVGANDVARSIIVDVIDTLRVKSAEAIEAAEATDVAEEVDEEISVSEVDTDTTDSTLSPAEEQLESVTSSDSSQSGLLTSSSSSSSEAILSAIG